MPRSYQILDLIAKWYYNKNMHNKKLLLLAGVSKQAGEGGLILLIILTIIGGSVLYFRKSAKPTAPQPKAAPGVPTLTFASDPPIVNPGDDFNLILKVNPNGAEFHAFELYAKYDPTKAEPQDSVNPSANIVSSYPLIISTIDSANATITLIGTRTGSSFSDNQDQEVARVKLKKKADTQGNLNFTWDENSKLGNKLELEKINSSL